MLIDGIVYEIFGCVAIAVIFALVCVWRDKRNQL
jgi:uncharacterized membrane protein YkvI